MLKTTDSGHQSFTFVLFCWLLAENFKKSAEKNTYEVFMTGGSVFSEPPCILPEVPSSPYFQLKSNQEPDTNIHDSTALWLFFKIFVML